MPWEDHDAREHVARTEQMLSRLETLPDNAARAHATEALQALVELYGECLDRIMGHAASAGAGDDLLTTLVSDELVGHLLLVHDLHPDSVESRVLRALEDVRPFLKSHGGEVELLALEGPVARLRLHTSGKGCKSTSATLEVAVQEAVTRAAPEIAEVKVKVAEPEPSSSPQTLIPVADLFRNQPTATR
jgi:Fe-S cluster biogenesis protein NfuA